MQADTRYLRHCAQPGAIVCCRKRAHRWFRSLTSRGQGWCFAMEIRCWADTATVWRHTVGWQVKQRLWTFDAPECCIMTPGEMWQDHWRVCRSDVPLTDLCPREPSCGPWRKLPFEWGRVKWPCCNDFVADTLPPDNEMPCWGAAYHSPSECKSSC